MKRNKSNRLIAILCAIVMFAEQIWGSGLYVNAAGETDATTVSDTLNDQTEEPSADDTTAEETKNEETAPEENKSEADAPEETKADDTTDPVADQDNEEKKDDAAPEEQKDTVDNVSEDNKTSDDSEPVDEKKETTEEVPTNDAAEENASVDEDEREVSEEKNNAIEWIPEIGFLDDNGVLTIGAAHPDHPDDYNVPTPETIITDEATTAKIKQIVFDANAKITVIPSGFLQDATNLESIDMTNAKALQDIDYAAFQGCTKLTDIKLGTLITIKPYAFKECTSLKSIDLASVTKIGDGAFEGCTSLNTVILRKNISCETFKYYASNIQYKACFEDCAIESLVFDTNMTVVPAKLFQGKNEGKSKVFAENAVIRIPSHVNDIGEAAFSKSNIRKIVIEGEDSLLRGISKQAFYKCYDLVDLRGDSDLAEGNKVHFPNRIQRIDDQAFEECKAVTKVVLPDSITYLGVKAFRACGKLEDLTLSAGTEKETTKERVFESCIALKEVIIPENLKAIGPYEFYDCYELATVTFDNLDENSYTGPAIRYIGEYAFATANDQAKTSNPSIANKIKRIAMPNSITELGKGVFANDINLEWAHVPQSITEIPEKLFWNCFELTTADMPSTIEKIGGWGFAKCLKLVLNSEEIHANVKNQLPSQLKEIGENAFNDCRKFPYIIIPEKVTVLGAGAFAHCFNATYLKIEAKGLTKCTGTGIFDNCKAVGSVEFPAGITAIPSNLFWGAEFNTNTCHIVIPKTVTEIGENAFAGLSDDDSTIRYISFEEGSAIQTIGKEAFRYNSDLVEIILPEGLKEIKEGAFSNTKNLAGIIIPESVTYIGKRAFADGAKLKNVEIRAVEFTTDVNKNNYTDTSKFDKECIFYNSNIRTIIIGSKVSSFPDYLFLGAKFSDSEEVAEADLITLPIPKSVKSIGDYCLPNVVNLKTINIEENSELERIGRYAFLDCKNLTSINIPDGVKEIDQYAFSGCKRLGVDNVGEFKLPANLEVLGKGAFDRCAKLGKSVTLTAGLKAVNDEIFKGCETLEAVTFLCAVDSIGASAFEGCVSLTEVAIPYGVESIGASAFKNCSNLTKVVIPSTVKTIGTGAFEGCDNAVFYVVSGSQAEKLLKAAGIADSKIHTYAYAIIYNLDEGINDPQNPSGFDATDQPIELKPATREGSTFIGWFEDEAFTKEVRTIEGRSADVTLYAKWVTEEYPITYVLRGGTNDPENPATYTMWTEDITLKAPTLKGASFQGWFTDLKDPKSQIKVIKKGTKGALTLYAKWNGKSAALPTANIASGSKVKKGSTLRLYCTTPGAVVYYSVSYEDAEPASPEAIPANEYKGGIIIEKRMKVRAIAVADGYLESEPADFEYDILDENSYWGDVVDKEDQDLVKNPANVPANIWVAGVPEEVEYTGEAITFNHIRVYDHKTLLTEGVDYTISYKNNKKIADKAATKAPTVLVKGKGSYSGSYPQTFTIKAAKIAIGAGMVKITKNDVMIKTPMVNYNYSGAYAADLGLTVTSGGKQLVEGTDYICVFSKNKAGNAKVTVKGAGAYKGKVTKKFTIKAADISKAIVWFVDDSGNEVSANSVVKYVPVVSYQKGGATPKVQVYIGERRLIKGVDYTVEYSNNTPGKKTSVNASLKIVGKGNFSGATGGIGFTVVQGAMSDIALGASGVKYSAKGVSAKDIKIAAIDTNGKLLARKDEAGKPLDYTVKCTYVLNGEVVELTDTKVMLAPDTPINVTITGENNYSGSVSTTCTVYSATIDKAKVKIPAQEYKGIPVEPGYDVISVKVKGAALTKSDYSIVGYLTNTKKGTAKVYLAGYGSYGGLKAVKFKIKAKKMVK